MSHFHNQKNKVPETVTGSEGTAKRNIIRRGGGGGGAVARKEGIAGKSIDDGSLYHDPYALDKHDPNYDSEEDDGRHIPIISSLHREHIAKSKLTLTQYKKLIQPIIAEFFAENEVDEVACSLQEIEAPEYAYEFVKRLINTSMDKNDHDREQVSRLLSELYPNILSSNMIGKGFERLFEAIDEIELDAPSARTFLASFIARAVIDEVLPPSFLNDSVVNNLGGEIIDNAKHLLSRDHAGAKLERIWGPGDGRPVEEMKVAVDQLLAEYLLSNDLQEAERCLRELNAPQFFHEVVKRAITIAMDKSAEQQQQMSDLFAHLSTIQILSNQQAEKGFNRVYEALGDISLDVPVAPKVLEGFLQRAVDSGVVSKNYQKPEGTK